MNSTYGMSGTVSAIPYGIYRGYFRLPLQQAARDMVLDMYSDLFEMREDKLYFSGALGEYISSELGVYRSNNKMVAEIVNGSNQSIMYLQMDQRKGIFGVTSKFWEGLFFDLFKAWGIKKMLKKYAVSIRYGIDTETIVIETDSTLDLGSVVRNYTIQNIIDSE